MINTISKTLEVQEKTQDIKQSPSMKIGTKSDARSRRNEVTEVTGRCTGHFDAQDAAPDAAQDAPIKRLSNSRVNNSDRTLHRTLSARVRSTSVRFQRAVFVTGRVRLVLTGRWLESDQ